MKVIIHLSLYVFSTMLLGQTLEYGNDTILCPGDQIQLLGESVDSSQFVLFSSPDTLELSEDFYSDTIHIGFDFTFYDSTYSTIVIGQNGIITFDTTKAISYNDWIINDPIPTSNLDTNSIMFPFVDIQGASAPYIYETIGSAPNRSFVVQILCGRLYDCWTFTSTLILHESTNEIEIHIGEKGYCEWNNNSAIQGLHHRNGQVANVVTGRNFGDNWTAMRDGKKWSPNGNNDYTITNIPYKIAVDTITYSWNNTLGDSFPYSDTLLITGQAVGESVGYFLGLSNENSWYCSEYSLSNDTSWINQDFQTDNLDTLNDFCDSGVGKIYSTSNSSEDNWYYWTDLSVFSDTLTDLAAGWYKYIYTGSNGCSITDSIQVLNENSFIVEVDSILCLGQNDGGIEIFPEYPYFTYNWIDFPNNSSNSVTNISSGSYTCEINSSVGCSNSLTIVIPEGNGVLVENEMISHESCFDFDNGSVNFDASTTYPPLVILWDGDTIIDQDITDIPPGEYLLSISDSMGCIYDSLITIDEISDSLSQTVSTSPEILGDDGESVINANGGTPPYQYNIGFGFGSSNSFNGLSSGIYESIVLDANGCSDTVTFFIDTEVGLNKRSLAQLVIFPIPVNETLEIQLSERIFKVAIHDQQGRLIIDLENIKDKTSIDVSQFPKGIYRLSVYTEEYAYQKAFVVN